MSVEGRSDQDQSGALEFRDSEQQLSLVRKTYQRFFLGISDYFQLLAFQTQRKARHQRADLWSVRHEGPVRSADGCSLQDSDPGPDPYDGPDT